MSTATSSREQLLRRKNLRLALILSTIAAVFFIGFMAKMVMLSHPH
jgi:hypothetical protein